MLRIGQFTDTFLPITFRARRKGRNSINIRKIIRIGWKAVGDFRKLKKEMNRHAI